MNPSSVLIGFFAGLWLVGEAAFAQVPDTLRNTIPAPPGGLQEYGGLGGSVAADAGLVAVGVPYDSTGEFEAGVVKVFIAATGALLHVLPNPDPEEYDDFGSAVAMSGMRVVVGAFGDNTGANNAGSAYVFDLAGPTPTVPIRTLRNPSPVERELFGIAVGISGTQVVVGASRDFASGPPTGSVYVYELTSPTPTVPVQVLPNPTPAVDDNFGFAVAISGSRVVVGAPNDDVLGGFDEGRAYVYNLAGPTPTVPAVTLFNPSPTPAETFGYAVSISGTRVVIGVPRDDPGANDAGSAYVYDVAGATPTVPIATLLNPSPGAEDFFGWSVSISANRVLVGAYRDDSDFPDIGSAYVYDLSSGPPGVPVFTLNHPAPTTDSLFGQAVVIVGTMVVVGAPGDNLGARGAGSAFVYNLASVTPGVPIATLNDPGPSAFDNFGWSVAISGTRMVVGAPQDHTDGQYYGRAYVYDLASTTPTVPVLALPDPSPELYEYYGGAVAISGTRVVVGSQQYYAPPPAIATVDVFDLASATPGVPVFSLPDPTPETYDGFGYAVAIAGSRVVVGAPYEETAPGAGGRAYVYDLASATPTVPVVTLLNPNPSPSDYFGFSVAISGARVAVGGPNDSAGAVAAGIAYVYDLAGATPATPVVTLPNPSPQSNDSFGFALAISGTRVVVGVPLADTPTVNAGSAYVYDLTGATPTVPVTTLLNPSPGVEEHFGQAVAISGSRVVVGTPYDGIGAAGAGSAYVYDIAGGTPTVPIATLPNPTPALYDAFGLAVAIEGITVAIGAPYQDAPKADKGGAYVFAPADRDFDDDGLLDLWEYARFGTLSGHGPLDDSDGDGRKELLELAFDRDPMIPDAAAGPKVVVEGGYLTLTIAKRAGVTYLGQSAATPDTAAFSAATTTVVVNNATTLKVRDNFPMIGGGGQRFLKVKVTAAP